MKEYRVYEHIKNLIGEEYDEYCGMVEARNEQSAINKAKKQFKFKRSGGEYGSFVRQRRVENLYVKSLF